MHFKYQVFASAYFQISSKHCPARRNTWSVSTRNCSACRYFSIASSHCCSCMNPVPSPNNPNPLSCYSRRDSPFMYSFIIFSTDTNTPQNFFFSCSMIFTALQSSYLQLLPSKNTPTSLPVTPSQFFALIFQQSPSHPSLTFRANPRVIFFSWAQQMSRKRCLICTNLFLTSFKYLQQILYSLLFSMSSIVEARREHPDMFLVWCWCTPQR